MRIVVIAMIAVGVSMITGGCITKMGVNFGNGTAMNIRVLSSETGQEVEVAPSSFKKLPHSSGDLVVTAQSNGKLRFRRVAPFDVDRKYYSFKHSIFRPNSVTLNVMMETNMLLYVVMPGSMSVDEKVEQPKGYPKVGEKAGN